MGHVYVTATTCYGQRMAVDWGGQEGFREGGALSTDLHSFPGGGSMGEASLASKGHSSGTPGGGAGLEVGKGGEGLECHITKGSPPTPGVWRQFLPHPRRHRPGRGLH